MARSWLFNLTGAALEVAGGSATADSVLVTGCGTGIYVGNTSMADLRFVTITACGTGVEQAPTALDGLSITASIVYDNSVAELVNVPCSSVSYTDTDPDCCGENGNLCASPLFQAPAQGNYELLLESPCIEAGFDPATFGGVPVKDFNGVPRLMDADYEGLAHPDCGAFEADFSDARKPGEVPGLVFDDGTRLVWGDASSASGYAVYRGLMSTLGYDYQLECRGETEGNEFVTESTAPLPGEGYIYLVSAFHKSGNEGSLGFGTAAERSNFAACP
jgi:hypothetical protein